jgi:hypothetical protein
MVTHPRSCLHASTNFQARLSQNECSNIAVPTSGWLLGPLSSHNEVVHNKGCQRGEFSIPCPREVCREVAEGLHQCVLIMLLSRYSLAALRDEVNLAVSSVGAGQINPQRMLLRAHPDGSQSQTMRAVVLVYLLLSEDKCGVWWQHPDVDFLEDLNILIRCIGLVCVLCAYKRLFAEF